LAGAALLAIGALVVISFAASWRGANQDRLEEGRLANCRAIEEHKRFHREEAAFNLEEFRGILRDLAIDPDSEQGRKLIETSSRRAAREQARFGAKEC
jgi:hypothetical protein